MGKFYNGYENISVNLIDFKGNDLARAVCKFGALGEFYEGADTLPYDPNHPHFQKVVEEVINGKTSLNMLLKEVILVFKLIIFQEYV